MVLGARSEEEADVFEAEELRQCRPLVHLVMVVTVKSVMVTMTVTMTVMMVMGTMTKRRKRWN